MSTDRILSQLLGSGAASGFAGALAGSLAGGLLTSKAGRKLGKTALQVGGIAAVGGLAYAAWNRYRQGQEPTAAATPTHAATPRATADERFIPPPGRPQEAEALGLVLLRTMIAAAHADGRLDERERHAIRARVASLELSELERAELLEQIERPVDLGWLVGAAHTPERAAEIYTAALLAIDVDTPAERAWLGLLAARLDLPPALVDEIHREAGCADRNAAQADVSGLAAGDASPSPGKCGIAASGAPSC
jgi:uncharacterized membrane protein YebE (DUF533 family)